MSGPGRRARSELWLALALVLAGSGLIYLAAGRQWVGVTVPRPLPLSPLELDLSGDEVVGALRPLSFVGVAGLAALAATRSRGRVLVGILLALAGAAAVAATALSLAAGSFDALERQDKPGARGLTGPEPGFAGWWVLAVLGGLLLAGGGLLVALRGRRWAALSSRYDTPAARAEKPPPMPDVATWDALDRGEDPTRIGPDGPAAPPRPDSVPARPRLDG
jgi:uncharacterized membrane protein (TIGR02234 family)